jgi:hypothetical protein
MIRLIDEDAVGAGQIVKQYHRARTMENGGCSSMWLLLARLHGQRCLVDSTHIVPKTHPLRISDSYTTTRIICAHASEGNANMGDI